MSTNSTEGQIMLIIIKTLWSQGTKQYLENGMKNTMLMQFPSAQNFKFTHEGVKYFLETC